MAEVMGMRVIALGTAGGPRFWRTTERSGIATAIVVDDGFYLVDCGQGVGRQVVRAGLDLGQLKGIFITHLHSDHTVDLNGVMLFSLASLQHRRGHPVPIIGPGDRGMLPPVSPRAETVPEPFHPAQPTPGTAAMVQKLMEAHATDINDRVLDALRPSPLEIFRAQDIELPAGVGFHPNENPAPEMEPFEVLRDEAVVVKAVLVRHPPLAPAFAFRFDVRADSVDDAGSGANESADGGAVVISGDTAYTDNLVRLADGAGLLLHEALDFAFMERQYRERPDATSRASLEHHHKSHSSVADAIRVAEQARVPRLALHHLVPGTVDRQHWLDAGTGFAGELLVPDDLDELECGRSAD
ncbi:MBL fold metallo-hydrolase [Citricoccus sp. GCM10030269]|uniref:MBL fold metallo-hydrolase n=1 Tax=Citricoccus sp. GCM10030269 TaxID=3273388 RepID=UPI003616035A